MVIARALASRCVRDRSIRWLIATVIATSIVGAAVAPALAVDAGPSASPGLAAVVSAGASAAGRIDRSASVDRSASASGSVDASAIVDATATPSPTPTPDPGATPSPTPVPTATPAPSATPVPTASPSPTPLPTPTPVPSPTPTPWPTASWPTAVTTVGTSIRFYGHGYGHGVGMNQYGAKGRAAEGQTADQILGAYFKGSVMSTTLPTLRVRVLVLSGFAATSTKPLVIYGRGGAWGLSGVDTTFPAGAQLRAWKASGAWHLRVLATNGATRLYSATASGAPTVVPIDPDAYLQLLSKPSAYDTYRGSLRLQLGTSTVSVVNHVRLDQYVRGTAPVEMPVSWPREAVRAQVIATRSYAVASLHASTGTYDMTDDSRAQIYRGIEAERPLTDDLVAAEPGAVIRYDGRIVKAFYFSTGGGATENNEYVFVSSSGTPGTSKVAYLRGIVDRSAYGVPFDAGAPYYRWATSTVSRTQLSAIFAKDARTNVGTITRLDLRKRGVSGRLYRIVLYGSKGTKTVSADTFRAIYNAHRPSPTASNMLRSNLFDTKPSP